MNILQLPIIPKIIKDLQNDLAMNLTEFQVANNVSTLLSIEDDINKNENLSHLKPLIRRLKNQYKDLAAEFIGDL